MTNLPNTNAGEVAGLDGLADLPPRYTAFTGTRLLARGELGEVLAALRDQSALPAGTNEPVLVFDDRSGKQVELDQRFDAEGAVPSPDAPARGPGRPKLGVVAREVTLLPRHWDWLNRQPGGASVALRRLVDEARRSHAGADSARQAQESAYAFISAIAGNFADFEEATRALFAADHARFEALTASWPAEVQTHARQLAAPAFESSPAAGTTSTKNTS